jgi:hypothetical protein
MFDKNPDERLSLWSAFRKKLEEDSSPLESTAIFWAGAPLIIHNYKIDPYNYKSWPTPWEIIVDNRYDDFTLALMMAYTLKLTNRFKNNQIQVKTMVDYSRTKLYNLVFIDNNVLNYQKEKIVNALEIDETLYLENQIDIVFPR